MMTTIYSTRVVVFERHDARKRKEHYMVTTWRTGLYIDSDAYKHRLCWLQSYREGNSIVYTSAIDDMKRLSRSEVSFSNLLQYIGMDGSST